ncbi:helix-turn-helix domain-containing protein [Neobacillus dielmonensis]|uniref:helix-turn-helix domain-containing protein n=1 Tax=Neobacillus dielmonensis TaxID=1347369 RepID=UPI001C0F71BD|nr:helix-turn-helix domain-containing protein [Neobacillus dielmonensis]
MKHKPKYFYRIFIPFILVGTLGMILFNGFAYLFTKNSFEDKITKEKQESVVQTMNTLEQKLQTLDYTFNSYIHDTAYKSYIRQPLTVSQFDQYRSIHEQLNYISSFGPNQTSVDLVSLEGNWRINEKGLKQLTEQDRSEIEAAYLSLPHDSTWIKEEQQDKTIKLIKRTPFYQSKKYGVMIIDIPLKSFSNLIYQSSENSPIYIYSKDGQLLFPNSIEKDDSINQKVIKSLLNQHERTGITDINLKGTDKYKVVYSKSDYNGWLYVSKISDADLAQNMKATMISSILMSSFLLLITLIIAYVSSDYLSKPIRELQKFIPLVKKEGVKDEFELIGNSIREVLAKNQSLEDMVTSQQEQLKTLFMFHLFHGRMDGQEIQEEMQGFDYTKTWACLYVIAIQFDSLENSQYTRNDKDLLLVSTNQIVSELIDPSERLTPIVYDSETQATIFICHDTDYEQHVLEINQFGEKIQSRIKEIFNLSISIGISKPFENLTDSRTGLLQGIDSLKYRLKVGKGSIIFYESISGTYNNKQINTYFPKMLENQLFDTIKLGESEKAKEILHLLLADMYKHSPTPQELELNMMRFVNDLMGLMQVMGMDTIEVDGQKTIYQEISEMNTAEEIELFIKNKIVYPLTDMIVERTDSQFKTIADKMLYIIHHEYDTELSLESIASRLHYNKNYLSSIFKKEFNQSFSKYLSLYRFDMAKKWLKETNLSVKEISEKLQYNNSQNFIRSFQKIEGTTPGKYRDLHRDDSLFSS